MRQIEDDMEIISAIADVKEKRIADVGCGAGDLVRKLIGSGANVTGIDTAEWIEKAKTFPPAGNETYLEGGGENLSFPDNSLDMVIFFASFHHVPESMLDRAIVETYRVLKPGGRAIFLEPVARDGSYTELIRMVEDEGHIQELAYDAIGRASRIGFKPGSEEMIYFARSLEDFRNLVGKYVEDEEKRPGYIARAEEIATGLSREAGMDSEAFVFKSICRLNVFLKR